MVLSNLIAGTFFKVKTRQKLKDSFIFQLLEDRPMLRLYTAHMPTLVLKLEPCGRLVCDLHVREFDEGNQCAEHWPKLEVYSVE